ncbi:pyruvate kinase [Oricola sp.]|uniref:pyruvate kinase n=1 Tax=Oricola sp. TaxID=1979950 RepID=UPI003BAD5F9B
MHDDHRDGTGGGPEMAPPSTDCIEACRAELAEKTAEIDAEYRRILADWLPHMERAAFRGGAENLAYYLAARQYDLTGLQGDLAALGLSSLGRSESHPRQSLEMVGAALDRMTGHACKWPDAGRMAAGIEFITAEQDRFFGDYPGGRSTRIMVTMPEQGARDAAYVERLVAAGASCFRINCAHDGPEVWSAMIANIAAAAGKADRRCPVLMDVAGPKCRIESIDNANARRLHRGDRFRLSADNTVAGDDMPAFSISFPHVVAKLNPGALVWIDDGKIGGRVMDNTADGAILEVIVARDKGEKLKLEKGVNFPSVDLEIDPLTAKDRVDMEFVARHADLVGCSFVQRPEDIRLITAELARHRGGRPRQPLLLKIETSLAVRNLPRLIVEAGSHQPVAVMIARGDLAMEVGTERLSEVQEEILWLCEAAHIPAVWATQVLQTLLKTGAPSRAEVTDAAMGQRAECVMLNKGPYVEKTIAFLAGILRRMDRHQFKKTARLSALTSWRGPQPIE